MASCWWSPLDGATADLFDWFTVGIILSIGLLELAQEVGFALAVALGMKEVDGLHVESQSLSMDHATP